MLKVQTVNHKIVESETDVSLHLEVCSTWELYLTTYLDSLIFFLLHISPAVICVHVALKCT